MSFIYDIKIKKMIVAKMSIGILLLLVSIMTKYSSAFIKTGESISLRVGVTNWSL